ncbi:MAG: RidA family protein [Dehalococcoidia bacterium]|nr:MAG: RidA family protein [Dehalococcoidia bacterium]
MTGRIRVPAGGPWGDRIGYSRAVRVDDRVWVSGTTGTRPDGTVPEGTEAQTRLALGIIEQALREAGSSGDEAVRVRVFATDIDEWEAIGAILVEHFGRAKPAMTMVQVARLIDPEHRIEIEVDAVIGSAR